LKSGVRDLSEEPEGASALFDGETAVADFGEAGAIVVEVAEEAGQLSGAEFEALDLLRMAQRFLTRLLLLHRRAGPSSARRVAITGTVTGSAETNSPCTASWVCVNIW